MELEDIVILAKSLGVAPCKKEKTELVRAIQKKEGYCTCYATDAAASCERLECSWRSDCFALFSSELHDKLKVGSG